MFLLSKSSTSVSDYYSKRGDYRGPYVEYEKSIVNTLESGMKILDVGCGRTFPMAQKWLATGAQVYGLDPVIDHDSLPADVEAEKGGVENINYPVGIDMM